MHCNAEVCLCPVPPAWGIFQREKPIWWEQLDKKVRAVSLLHFCHPPREAKRPCLTAITSLQSEHLLDRQCVPPADNGRKKKRGRGQISSRVPGALPALHICSQPLSRLQSPELPSDGQGAWGGPELTSQKGDLASLSWSLGLELLPELRGTLRAERVNQGHVCEES